MILKFSLTLFFTLIILLKHLSGERPVNTKAETTTSVDSIIQKKIKEAGIVGIGAAIIIDKKLVWEQGYGYSDKENKIPFTTSTVMNIASISKTFTGACMMKAAEDGKLSLDEDINSYLPFKVVSPNFPEEKITLRQLGTHTSGLADRYPFYDDSTYFYGGKKPEDLGEFLKNYFVPGGKHYSKDNFLKSKPGTYREYSNIAAGLAGYIVEIRTEKKLSEYAKQHIFTPLKMTRSAWSLADINIADHTKLYEKNGDDIKPVQLYEGTTYPDGGIRTSVSDLSKFFISLLNEGQYNGKHILKKESAREMLRFQFDESNKPENVKLKNLNSGIFWATKMNITRIGHNGSDPGVRTFMLTDLNKEIAIVLFFNTSLSENEESKYGEIYEELYQYALSLKIKGAGRD